MSLGLMELALDLRVVVGRLLQNRVSRARPVDRRTLTAIKEVIQEGRDLSDKAQRVAQRVALSEFNAP